MKKFEVWVNCKEYYLTKDIVAKDKYEAQEKYQEMLNNGDVEVNKSEWEEVQVREVK